MHARVEPGKLGRRQGAELASNEVCNHLFSPPRTAMLSTFADTTALKVNIRTMLGRQRVHLLSSWKISTQLVRGMAGAGMVLIRECGVHP